MQAIDKLKSDLDEWARRAGKAPGNREFDSLRTVFARTVPKVPDETLAAIFTTFLSRYGSGDASTAEGALEWLGGVGSLLLCDYDGTPFSADDWVELREIVTIDSGDIDMETLTYVLNKALENGAL